MRYAIVRDGIVLNVCEWDGGTPYNLEGCILVRSDEAGPGDAYDGVRFTHPILPEVVPEPTLEDRLEDALRRIETLERRPTGKGSEEEAR